MPGPVDHLRVVGRVVRGLRRLSLDPVLVGAMALVVLGSRRVTRDFDFVVPKLGDRLAALVGLFYDHGLELVSRLSESGDVVRTISSRDVAAIRLRLDEVSSAYFFSIKTGLRIDLLFDFPIPAATLTARATRLKVRAQLIDIASEEDLRRLKQIAKAARSAPGDAEDLAFLEARRKRT